MLSPVQHAAFCRPASFFTGRSTLRRRGCDEKGVCQALALHLSDFSVLNDYLMSRSVRAKSFISLSLHPFYSEEQSLNGPAWT